MVPDTESGKTSDSPPTPHNMSSSKPEWLWEHSALIGQPGSHIPVTVGVGPLIDSQPLQISVEEGRDRFPRGMQRGQNRYRMTPIEVQDKSLVVQLRVKPWRDPRGQATGWAWGRHSLGEWVRETTCLSLNPSSTL